MSVQNDTGAMAHQNMQQHSQQAAQRQAFDNAINSNNAAQQTNATQQINQTQSVQLQQQMNSPVDQVRNNQVDMMQNAGLNPRTAQQAQQIQQEQITAQKVQHDPHTQAANTQVPKNPAIDPAQITNFLKRIKEIPADVLSIIKEMISRVRDEEIDHGAGEETERRERSLERIEKI